MEIKSIQHKDYDFSKIRKNHWKNFKWKNIRGIRENLSFEGKRNKLNFNQLTI